MQQTLNWDTEEKQNPKTIQMLVHWAMPVYVTEIVR